MKGRITVQLRPAILDVEGKAIARALGSLGFGEPAVRVGRVFEVDLGADFGADAEAARARLTEMAQKLLANPVMETFTIDVPTGTGGAP